MVNPPFVWVILRIVGDRFSLSKVLCYCHTEFQAFVHTCWLKKTYLLERASEFWRSDDIGSIFDLFDRKPLALYCLSVASFGVAATKE